MRQNVNNEGVPSRVFAVHGELGPFMRELALRQDIHEFSPAMINLAREISRHAVDVGLDDQKALLVLVLASMLEQRQGSTRMPLEAELLEARFVDLVGEDRAGAMAQRVVELASEPLPDLIGAPGDYKPLIVEDGALYQQRMHHHELGLVERLSARLRRPPNELAAADVEAALADVLEHMPVMASGEKMQLNAEQQYGLLTAVHQPLTLISGGPGTGKTTILVSLVRLAARLGIPAEAIALAAPTGKAANRMGEAFDAQLAQVEQLDPLDEQLVAEMPAPRTLHRLLGYSPSRKRFHHHRNNPLEARLVIVDESSMIDLFVMERLVDATPSDASLVLVGDADQLPSVNSGAVFRDLMPAEMHTVTSWREYASTPLEPHPSDELAAANAVRLEKSYRMDAAESGGAQILQMAHAVNTGDVSGVLEDLQVSETLGAFAEPGAGVTLMDASAVGDVAPWWYSTMLASRPNFVREVSKPFDFDGQSFSEASRRRLGDVFDHYSRAQMLTLTRVLPTGSRAFNDVCHARHLQHMQFSGGAEFATGDPVMMRQNDYQRGLFNGDHGIVLTVRSHGDDPERAETKPMVVFRRGERFVPFGLSGLRGELELAYAITVHKSQGSEFEHVGLLLPDEAIPLLTRELLYTGL
ncbi:MAG: exodeoxyribonuclease V subunit alpha, partial [Myxococcota bacterium]